MSDQPIPLTDAELAEKRRYVASRVARDHWGAAELAHVDHEAVWLATVDEVEIERDRQIANGMDLARRLAAAESSAAQYLREREDLEGALEAIAEHTTDEDTHHIARQALASLPSPEPTQRDREPQPTDGPDYHAEHSAWRRRNFPLATDRRWEKIDHIPSHKSPPDDGVIYLTVDRQPFRVRVGNYHTDTIREAAAVPVDYDLWLVRPGADDVKIAGRVYLSRSGDRFFTTPRYINASSPDPTQGEQ